MIPASAICMPECKKMSGGVYYSGCGKDAGRVEKYKMAK